MRSYVCANQLAFWARTEDWEARILALVGYGDAPADWAGDWAKTGERLGIGVGYAYVLVVGKMEVGLETSPSSPLSSLTYCIVFCIVVGSIAVYGPSWPVPGPNTLCFFSIVFIIALLICLKGFQ